MTYVDAALLDVTEWLCRRFQAWTGRTNVWLAFHLTNLSIVVYFAWVGALYWLSGLLALRVFVVLFCGGVFLMLTRTLFRTSIEASDAQAYRRVAKGLRNPRRVRDAQLRIAFLTLSIVLVMPLWFAYTLLRVQFILVAEALAVLTTAVLYILACDPLPPCEGKLRAWLPESAPARAAKARVSEEQVSRHVLERVRVVRGGFESAAILIGAGAVLAAAGLPPPQQPRGTPCAYEENCGCPVPGITLRWKAAYCMAVAQTDDVESGAVQLCLAAPDPPALRGQPACSRNAYWKTELCRAVRPDRKQADACARDRKFVPAIVARGARG